MNAIFTAICVLSALVLALTKPDMFLSSLLGGAENAVKTGFTLFCIYAVWMGLSKVAEKSRLTEGAARLLKRPIRKIFRTEGEAGEYIAMNLACNLIGIGGAATPYAVKAIERLDGEGNVYAQRLLFVINATSVQLVPTTVIALRAAAGSAAPSDIFLPSLICTAVSTAAGVALFLLCNRIWR